MATNESTKSKSNLTKKLVIAEQIVLATAVVAGIAFYGGIEFHKHQLARDQAMVQSALKAAATPAVAPASVAQLPK